MGQQYTFICLAECIPSCSFTWTYMGNTYDGDQVQLPIMHQGQKPKFASHMEIVFSDYSKAELLTCEATNTISHVTISAATNLTVIGESHAAAAASRSRRSLKRASSAHRPLLGAPHVSGPAGGGRVLLSGVRGLSEPSLHYVAQGQRAGGCVRAGGVRPRQRHRDLQAPPAVGRRLIPVCGGRGRLPDPVRPLRDEREL